MNIEIIGTESLGVRGLCCFIRTRKQRILIDPGIALGYNRYGLLPHPLQVAVDERLQKKILQLYQAERGWLEIVWKVRMWFTR